MQKQLKKWSAVLLCAACSLLWGCEKTDGTPETALPVEIIWSDQSTKGAPAADARCEHILDTLELCISFASDVRAQYPQIPIELDQDVLNGYYAALDAPEPDYDSLEAQLSVTTLKLRQKAHAQIDNILKMGNDVPAGLYDLLEDYDEKFSALGW